MWTQGQPFAHFVSGCVQTAESDWAPGSGRALAVAPGGQILGRQPPFPQGSSRLCWMLVPVGEGIPRGDYRLVNYICIKKDSSLLFHSLVSSRFIYGPEPSLPSDFLFPLLLWAPLPPSSWWSRKSYPRPLSLLCPPAPPAGESLCAD